MAAAEWRITPDDRKKYETYFQQCAPIQGYVFGDKAREFFVKSGLSAEILRKIWDLADLSADGRLDKREFIIACHLISSQVKRRIPLPATLPPTLLSDAIIITASINGQTALTTSLLKTNSGPLPSITPGNRAKYVEQFHSLVDVTKTNGFMSAAQAKSLLEKTSFSQTVLRQIWDLADQDKDGRLNVDEFVIAMHCCDVVRSGHSVPSRLPNDWRSNLSNRESPALNFDLRDLFQAEPSNNERRASSSMTFEDKRQKNYQDGLLELERRRTLLREQEEREKAERALREQQREFELQKKKEEQERQRQLAIQRQIERQRQIENQKQEEKLKQIEQREAARRELERKNRVEWERQRLKDLSSQKQRLVEEIKDIKFREKSLVDEMETLDETVLTRRRRLQKFQEEIENFDKSMVELGRRGQEENNQIRLIEEQKRENLVRLNRLRSEKQSISSSFENRKESFGNSIQREVEENRFVQDQLRNIEQQQKNVDEQINKNLFQTKQFQNQIEQLRSELKKLEEDAKKEALRTIVPPAPTNQFAENENIYLNNSIIRLAPNPIVVVDPFRTVDPFATQNDLTSSFPNNGGNPFVEDKTKSNLKPSKKTNRSLTKKNVDRKISFESSIYSNLNDELNFRKYRALYDYSPNRDDELTMNIGDVITVDAATADSGEQWIFGRNENGAQGYFPANYVELIDSSNETKETASPIDTNSVLNSGSWAFALADYQGKTADKHLSFVKGDLILVQKQKDSIWYSGQLNGKIGWFPRNYVRPATEAEIPIETNRIEKPAVVSSTLQQENETAPIEKKGRIRFYFPSRSLVWRHAPDLPNLPEIYRAIYAYEAKENGDLSFNADDRITVLRRDGDWWFGRIEDRTGIFPANYVEKVENATLETAVSIIPFFTNEDGRLSFDQGQLIYIRRKGDKGWFQGEIRNSDQPIRVGWFPANCVQTKSTSSLYVNSQQEQDERIEEKPKSDGTRYISIFPYEAQQDDELSFPTNSIIEVLQIPNDNPGWYQARLGQNVGLIPATYVQPFDEQQNSPSISVTKVSQPPTRPVRVEEENIYANIDDLPGSSSVTEPSTTSSSTNVSRIAAVRELIETEQRYVDDLRVVQEDFIDTLIQSRVLTQEENQQIFINWKNLIECNSRLLEAFKEKVDFREQTETNGSTHRNLRSGSASNLVLQNQQISSRSPSNSRHRSFTPEDFRNGTNHHSSKNNRNGTSRRSSKIKIGNDFLNDSNDSSSSKISMTVNDSTLIGQILCEHLPRMDDDYFQYCACRAQSNKFLQNKIENSEKFRLMINLFQDRNAGLSLNGFLTKPIQRVTRYPLLIEKIVKHTPNDHPDSRPIKQAFDVARKLNERINQQISAQESSMRLDWLQQHILLGSDDNTYDGFIFDEYLKFNSLNKFNQPRQLILHGLLSKVPGGKDLLAFLFNDFLLFSTIKNGSSNWQMQLFEGRSNLQLKLYRTPIMLTDIIIANDSLNDQLTFSITTRIYDKPLSLKTQQTNIRTLWVRSINTAVEESQQIERSILMEKSIFTMAGSTFQEKRSMKNPVARLLIVVQEAQDLMPIGATRDRHRSIDPYCEVTVGPATLRTSFIKRTVKPKWNTPMQFLLYDFPKDLMTINVFDHEYFSPNENLGSTTIELLNVLPCPVTQFLSQPSKAFTQMIYLNSGASVVIQFDIQMLTTS